LTDKNLIKIVAEFRAGILGPKPSKSMCFAVCAPLAGYLGFYGVQAKIVEGVVVKDGGWETNHFWLELADGRVLDPTADQFNDLPDIHLPPVYLGPRPAWFLKTDAEIADQRKS